MPIKVVFFDFHFTLAECYSQLEIEMHKLPIIVVQKLLEYGQIRTDPNLLNHQAVESYRALRTQMNETGLSLSLTDRAAEVLKNIGYSLPRVVIEQVIADAMDSCLPDVKLVSGAEAAVKQLANTGYQLGVISTTGYPLSLENGLERIGLRRYFSQIITSGGEGIFKSNPEIFRRAAARLGVLPEEALHIGDQIDTDIRPAKAAGFYAIWFTGLIEASAKTFRSNRIEDEEAGKIADAWVDNMDNLAATITKLNTAKS